MVAVITSAAILSEGSSVPVTKATFSLAMEKTALVEINLYCLSCTNTHPSVTCTVYTNLPSIAIGLCEYSCT